MNMFNIDLFDVWALSISFSTLFLTVVSIYLFIDSKSKRMEDPQKKANIFRTAKSFLFVFALIGLLIFYIFSIQLGSGVLPVAVFTVGNIIMEALLIIYLLRNRETKSENA